MVVGGDQIEARLFLPGRRGDGTGCRFHAPRHLGVGHEGCNLGIDVGREGGGEFRLVECQETIDRRQDRRNGGAGRRVGDQRGNGLALIRREGGDIDDGLHLFVGAGFGNDHAAIGVADEYDRAVLCGDRALGDGDVIGKRQGRVLDDGDVVAVLLEDVVDALPAGAIDEAAVNEHDILGGGGGLSRRQRACGEGESGGGDDGLDHFRVSLVEFVSAKIVIAIIIVYADSISL
ncbi:hypothetical protein D9M72_533320 [compost metagenome]